MNPKKSKFPYLSYLMWKKGYNIATLSKKIPMTPSTLGRKLAGDSDFSYSEIKALMEIFEMPFEKLFDTKEGGGFANDWP